MGDISNLVAVFRVPEAAVRRLRAGMEGTLVPGAYPKWSVRIVVESVEPVEKADTAPKDRRVRAKLVHEDLSGRRDWLRPGMRGVATLDVTMAARPAPTAPQPRPTKRH